jgi:hypothetical protein
MTTSAQEEENEKRNQKRKEEFLANKAASAEVKKEVIPKSIEKATLQILFFNRDFSR